ncbi:MAG: hypothetical protein KDD53_01470 [Bdellovibrionales bacterium]|nr:hypothetical protein [Bdellovibrionales bacterium]
MESLFNTVTAFVMVGAILLGVLAFPLVFLRCTWELLEKRSKPGSWYLKTFLFPFGFFVIALLTFLLRSVSPVFWGKPTGGLFTVKRTIEINNEVVHSEKESADVLIEIPKSNQLADVNTTDKSK